MKVLAISASPHKGGNSFIDRCLPRYQEIKDKAFYYIITAADPEYSAAAETIAGFRGYLRCLSGTQEKGIIYGTGMWDMGDVYKYQVFEKAYEAGKPDFYSLG